MFPLFFITQLINFSGFYEFNLILVIFLFIISIGLYITFLVGPAVFMGMKRGLGWGIGTSSRPFYGLFFYLLVIMMILLLIQDRQSGGGYPIPMMNKVLMRNESSSINEK